MLPGRGGPAAHSASAAGFARVVVVVGGWISMGRSKGAFVFVERSKGYSAAVLLVEAVVQVVARLTDRCSHGLGRRHGPGVGAGGLRAVEEHIGGGGGWNGMGRIKDARLRLQPSRLAAAPWWRRRPSGGTASG
uniref:Uncharacterized protein n=1 Tax=Arundo donax TaxID=35708 RepID=A0A0A9FJE3_ARUDO